MPFRKFNLAERRCGARVRRVIVSLATYREADDVFSSELKKGSSEMLILSLLEARPRHGYEIGKLIETRSGGKLTFALPTLYPTLLRL